MKNPYVIALLGILVVAGISVYAIRSQDNNVSSDVAGDTDSLNMIIGCGTPVTKEGRVVCLPHVNQEGPQTLECAFGLKTTDGLYYGLDAGDMPDQVSLAPMDRDVRIEGRLTAAAALSSDFWNRYPIEGIITVTAITVLNSP